MSTAFLRLEVIRTCCTACTTRLKPSTPRPQRSTENISTTPEKGGNTRNCFSKTFNCMNMFKNFWYNSIWACGFLVILSFNYEFWSNSTCFKILKISIILTANYCFCIKYPFHIKDPDLSLERTDVHG